MEKANIVITHGGTGAIIGAVKKGKKVIAVPRLAKYGEHVDDHQLQLIKQFDDLADPRMNVSDMVVNLLDVLPLKGAQVNTFRSASRFQIAVGDGLPAMPPNLGVLLVVPVHGVFLVAFPVPRRESDALAIFVKVVYLAGFWEPLAVFIHCPERQQNVGVWVSIFLVVDGKVGDHSFGNKLFLTKFFYHGKVLLFRDFHRERQHDAPGKLGVPLVLHGFHGVPEGRPVCISGRRMGRQHDLGVDKLFLLVVEFRFLVVLAEQPFAALVSGPGNSGLPLASLDDGNFEMRTRNRHHPLMTFESFSCKNHGIMVLLFWISKQKAGEPMSERKSQQELDLNGNMKKICSGCVGYV